MLVTMLIITINKCNDDNDHDGWDNIAVVICNADYYSDEI